MSTPVRLCFSISVVVQFVFESFCVDVVVHVKSYTVHVSEKVGLAMLCTCTLNTMPRGKLGYA